MGGKEKGEGVVYGVKKVYVVKNRLMHVTNLIIHRDQCLVVHQDDNVFGIWYNYIS